VDSLSNTTPR